MRVPTVATLVLLCVAVGGGPVWADDKVAAEEAFLAGKELTEQGKLAEACDAFARSQRLDPQFGTQYNLALCYESLGRTATAWGLFRELAQRDTMAKRRKDAEKRASKLKQRLARVSITIEGPPIQGLLVRLDGDDVTATIGVATAVDPGEYNVEASAAGYAPFRTRVSVGDAGGTIAVTIPELQRPERGRRPAEPTPVATPPKPLATAPAPVTRGDERRRLGLILGGSGLAVTAGGAVLGVIARGTWSDAEKVCGADRVCDSADDLAHSRELADQAGVIGNASTAVIATGAAVLVTGVVLWLTAPSDARERQALQIAPVIDGDAAYVTIGGAL